MPPAAAAIRPTGRGETASALKEAFDAAPAFLPFLDRPPLRIEAWYAPFLQHFARHGSRVMAAMHAEIGRASVYRALERDPVFKDEVEYAHRYYVERIEWEGVESARVTGNPVGHVVRNKAEQPERYIERHATLQLAVSAQLQGPDAAELLRTFLTDCNPATLQMLAAGPPAATVIDVTPTPPDQVDG